MAEKQQFTFNQFSNGTTTDPTRWKTHGFYSAGLDLLGVQAIGGILTGSRPDTLQLTQILEADSVSGRTGGATGAITGLAQWIASLPTLNFGAAGTWLAFETKTSAGQLFWVSGSQWALAKATSAAVGGGGLGVLGNNLYYGQDAVVGQLTSAGTFNNNFATFSPVPSTSSPRPMGTFAGKLYIGNDNVLSSIDSSGSFTAAALTLPVGFTIRSMATTVNFLWISADNGVITRIFLWSGGTATFQEFYDVAEKTAITLTQKQGRIFGIGSQGMYQVTESGVYPIYPPMFQIGQVPTLGRTGVWENQLMFAITDTGTYTNGDPKGGLWMFGAYQRQPYQNYPANEYQLNFHLHLMVPPYNAQNNQLGGFWSDGDGTIKVAYEDTAAATSAQYNIASIQNNGNKLTSTANAYYETLPMDMDSGNKKIFHSIKPTIIDSPSTGQGSIAIYYRLDVNPNAPSPVAWTLLGTYNSSNNLALNQTLPIRQIGRNIQFKFVFTTSGTSTSQMNDYTIVYEILDAYR